MTSTNSDPRSRTAADPTATSVELVVEGMHCGSCVALIEETLTEQAGVTSASVDLESARAVVSFDPTQTDVAVLAAVVAEAGYAATPVG